MNNKIFILTILAFIISSCTGTNQTTKLYSKLRNELKQKHGIKEGDIVAKFDLEETANRPAKLFHPNYGHIINNSEDNSKFLKNFTKKYHHKDLLQSSSYKKIGMMQAFLLEVDKKHKILTSSVKNKLNKIANLLHKTARSPKNLKENYLEMLASLHNSTKHIPMFVPITNPAITSKFGFRVHPYKKSAIHHSGLDLAGKKNCKIYAAADGIVEMVGKSPSYGNMILIKHDKAITTKYAHLSKIHVKSGDKILLGQDLGHQGCTGTARGHHLHFEVIIRGNAVDPLVFIDHSI